MSSEKGKSSFLSICFVLVVFVVVCINARPQRKDVVLNIAASAIPRWKLDVHGEFLELGSRLGDKDMPINTIDDLDRVIMASKKLWEKYLQQKENWAKKIFSIGGSTSPPTTAIHMVGKLRNAIKECNYNGYTDLIQAYEAAMGEKDLYLEAKDQVKSAVIVAISLHGKTCRDTYYNKFTDIYENTIHEYMLGLVDFLFDDEFLSKIFPDDNQLAIIGSSKTALAINRYSDHLLDKLIVLVKKTQYEQYIGSIKTDEKRTRLVVPSEFSTQIVAPLLIQPCEEFTGQLKDIFYPAMIDVALDDEKISEINYKHDKKFMDMWKKFIICAAIHQNRDDVYSALRMSVPSRIESTNLLAKKQ